MTELLAGLEDRASSAASCTRPATSLLTDSDAGAVWRSVSVQVVRYLRSRGVPTCDAEDLAQEVALRAMDRAVGYVAADDLAAWCIVVARNLHVDAVRRGRTCTSLHELDDLAHPGDLAVTVEHRLALDRVRVELEKLSDSDVEVLLAERAVDGTSSRLESTRLAVRRHRLRRRLAKVASGLLSGLGLLGLRSRRGVVLLTPVAAVAFVATLLPMTAIATPPAGQGIATEHTYHLAGAPAQPAAVLPPARARRPAENSQGTRIMPKSGPAATHTATVDPDGQHQVYVDRRPAKPDDHLVCLDHLVVVPDTCV